MWQYNYSNSYELYHYGVLGMKWGVHIAQKKQAVKSMASNKGHKYAGVLDAANSAARSYYKKQNIDRKSDKTNNFNEYKKLQSKSHKLSKIMDQKTARLTEAQVKAGRYRIARNRNYRRTAVSALIGGATGGALVASGAAFIGLPVAAGAYVISRYATGGRRYRREQKSYEKYATAEDKK